MDSRHIPLEGSLNLRDLGGYPSADGRVVRSRCLFRSDELHALTDADLEVVAGLGIRVVADLRNDLERAARPSRLPDGIERLDRRSPGASVENRTLADLIVAGELPEKDDGYMIGVYIDLLDRLAPELQAIVERAVEAHERPLLFHCAAGKDRTGLTAALLLGLLGVPDEVVLDDYELTSRYWGDGRMVVLAPLLAEHGVAPERVRPLVEARRPVLAAALDHVNAEWGGFEGYAIDRLALAPEVPEQLRATLLVDG